MKSLSINLYIYLNILRLSFFLVPQLFFFLKYHLNHFLSCNLLSNCFLLIYFLYWNLFFRLLISRFSLLHIQSKTKIFSFLFPKRNFRFFEDFQKNILFQFQESNLLLFFLNFQNNKLYSPIVLYFQYRLNILVLV